VDSDRGLGHVAVAYSEKDNPIELTLFEDDVEYDFSTAKSVRVKFGAVILDSDTDTEAFDLAGAASGKLVLRIGSSNIAAKTYNAAVELTDASDRVLYFGHTRVVVKAPAM
jgi:hypothetical protein